jgi:Peptidase family M1 domain
MPDDEPATDAAPASPTAPASPPTSSSSSPSSSSSSSAAGETEETPTVADAKVEVTDEERNALTFTGYDLDVHLVPARARIAVHAGLAVRNDGKAPLTRLALQISSSLVWESFGLRTPAGVVPLAFVQHRINSDADHTGVSREAVVTLPTALAPGEKLELVALYSGQIVQSAERLERIGAPAEQAAVADWDAISTDGLNVQTALRGYGNVLWYPVSSAPVFLGDGAKLFEAVGWAKERQQAATTRLRVAIEFTGEAPDSVYFCGRREQLTPVRENNNAPVAEGTGVATAEFARRPLGFRVPSLFVTGQAPTVTDGALLSAVSDQSGVLTQYAAAAAKTQQLLMDWLGISPLAPLNMLDHDGQPFEDAAFLVTPLEGGDPTALAPVLVHTLAHAWFQSSHVWLDEGVAQFMSLLWVETNDGREAATAQLEAQVNTLALAEPEIKPAGAPIAGQASATPVKAEVGQSLIDAHSQVYYRTKAAAVLWMLRTIAGEDALKKALQSYRKVGAAADANPEEFEKVLEQASGKDLRWFFDDWVYHDRGLPDLSIRHVSSRRTPDQGPKAGAWLIAVDVRNDGDAVAEVPVTVRSGTLTATERVRVAAHADAATRIVFQGTPDEVEVNDGSVPELQSSEHIEKVDLTVE